MSNKEQMINEFTHLISFAESLRQLDDNIWTTPLGEGKWTTRDVVAHIMLWDKYFFEEAIDKITLHQPVTVQHLNFDEFNKKALVYAENKDKQEIIDKTVQYRSEIIRHLTLLTEEEFIQEHVDGDGHPFSASNYVMGFIPHDRDHITQLQDFFALAQHLKQ